MFLITLKNQTTNTLIITLDKTLKMCQCFRKIQDRTKIFAIAESDEPIIIEKYNEFKQVFQFWHCLDYNIQMLREFIVRSAHTQWQHISISSHFTDFHRKFKFQTLLSATRFKMLRSEGEATNTQSRRFRRKSHLNFSK